MKNDERQESVAYEGAVLVAVLLDGYQPSEIDPLEELDGLATTAGARIVGRLTQRRLKPDVTTYLGKGKVEELKNFVEARKADVVIFDNDLNPGQIRNLEEALKVKVLDRTELILDIFATHAQTYEARLAVELAQLEYSLPRLKRMWTHLSRLKTGIGMRGPGEKQLEVDRRLVEKRIHDLKDELKQVERRKEREVRARRNYKTVSLVGYTNAGKSTLMNALTQAGVLAMDKLFATLDTRTRRWQLPNWGPVLLSDTVGFIKHLPHRLIASFKSTLSEAVHADLLMHVADASNPAVFDQINAVYQVLEEIGIQAKDTLLVLNKADAASQEQLDAIKNRFPTAVAVSARQRTGLDALADAVSDALSHSFQEVDVETSVDNGRLISWLASAGEVIDRRFSDDRAIIHCRLPQTAIGKISPKEATVRAHVNGEHGEGNGAMTTRPLSSDDDILGEMLDERFGPGSLASESPGS